MVKKYIDAGIALTKFLKAAASLAKQGVKQDDILRAAQKQFGEVSDSLKKQIDDIFEKSPLAKILDRRKAAKKSVEERKVLDMEGKVLDPDQPILGGKQTKMETSDLDDILSGVEGDKTGLSDDLLPEIDAKLLKNYNDEIKAGVDEIMSGDKLPATLRKSIEVDNLMLEYPGMSREFAKQIANDPNPKRKADILSMVKQTFELNKQGKSGDEIMDIFKSGKTGNETLDNSIILNNFDPKGRKPSAMGGRIGYGSGTPSKNRFTQLMLLKEEALDKGDMDKVRQIQSDIDKEFGKAQGGRIGYDMGGDVSYRANQYLRYIEEMKSMGVEPVSVEEFNKMLDAMREKNAQGGRIGYADGTENMMAAQDYSSREYKMSLIKKLQLQGLDFGAAFKRAEKLIELMLGRKKKLAAGGLPNILGF